MYGVEIDKDQSSENKVIIRSLLYSKGTSHHHFSLAEIQGQTGEWKSFIVEKRESFRCALIIDRWHEDTGCGLSRSGASWVIGLEGIFDFF